MSEANARIVIDRKLRDAHWVLPGDEGVTNVDTEMQNQAGFADYVLKDSDDFPICVVEAKKELISPLVGKEQARGYAEALNCRFVILTNSVQHYLWDIEQGSPNIIDVFPSLEQLELRKSNFNPPRQEVEEVGVDYVAQTQMKGFDKNPDYLDESRRQDFLRRNKLRLLRKYQLEAVLAIQRGIATGKDRFLLEMATGTGKTLTSSAIIKMFLRLYGVKRVLFLVDRLELETQAKKEFDEVLKNDFRTVIWKTNQDDWVSAEIVVSTVQSFIKNNKYKRIFRPDHFGLVISDEAHRSLGLTGRKVFEYFIGFKLGLTATPKDYLKAVDIHSSYSEDPRSIERRMMLDTYTTFGCESGEPTYRYSLIDGVRDGFLINPHVLDARTDVTTELLSSKGYDFVGVDEDGNEVEGTAKRSQFEKSFFSERTNMVFCAEFLKRAMRDPYTSEIGKTLIFCVSQNHAAKITQILNVMADELYPGKYSSDFAVQVTSHVTNSQGMTIDFRNNNLNGRSNSNPHYQTSKTRVCVTVGMMTTGYDCTDILNICMMRPVMSPSEFIQMKGRGTRKCDFSEGWISEQEIDRSIDPNKKVFYLFDFFANYEYFEKDFDYGEIVKLPTESGGGDNPIPKPSNGNVTIDITDVLKELTVTPIDGGGMVIDRVVDRFSRVATDDSELRDLVQKQDFESARKHIEKHHLEELLNPITVSSFEIPKIPDDWGEDNESERHNVTVDNLLEQIREDMRFDRDVDLSEMLLLMFGHINKIPTQQDCLDDEFDRFDEIELPEEGYFESAKRVFEAYAVDNNFRETIDAGRYADLATHPVFEAFSNLPKQLRINIPNYINKYVNRERLVRSGRSN